MVQPCSMLPFRARNGSMEQGCELGGELPPNSDFCKLI